MRVGCSSRQVYSEGVDDVRVRGGGGISGHNGISDFSLTSGKGRLMPERQHWLFKSGLKIKKSCDMKTVTTEGAIVVLK